MKPHQAHRAGRIAAVGVVGLLLLCLTTIGISALSNLGLPTHTGDATRLSETDKIRLAEIFHLRRTLGDTVWSGWGAADIPVILYNEEYAFLVDYPDPPPGWTKVPQHVARGGPWEPVPGDTFGGQVYYRQSLTDPQVTPQAFTVLVGNRWVASMHTLESMQIGLRQQIRGDLPPLLQPVFPYRLITVFLLNSSDWYMSGVLHESFHAYQGMMAPQRLAHVEEIAGPAEQRYPW
ncbi:MAG: hypothetical protein HY326_08160, partial [Chloroflexi bacterium]|nr:hypothetical protein [Chloroflexota bacterium]